MQLCNSDGTENRDNEFIGNINPIRYRGYYYDVETKLYYLLSRYYDSEVGRFISPDSVEYIAPETLGGLNLYSYCNNDPVMYYDPSGCASMSNGQVFDLMMFVFESGIGLAMSIMKWAVKNATRPNNIGIGKFLKAQSKVLGNLNKATNIFLRFRKE